MTRKENTYRYYTYFEGDGVFTSLREAESSARDMMECNSSVNEVDIYLAITVPINKASLLNILNTDGGGWIRHKEVAKKVTRRGPVRTL